MYCMLLKFQYKWFFFKLKIILPAGSSGGWKEELTDEMKKKFDEWERKYCPDPEILKQIRGEWLQIQEMNLMQSSYIKL